VRTAASTLLFAAIVSLASACGGSPPQPATTRATPPEPVTPRGAVAIPFVFSWKPSTTTAASLYRVTVSDGAERVLFEEDVRDTHCRPSAELTSMMADHAAFSWTVGVVSPDGTRVVSRSAPVTFSLK
jgi:hypothetical protein